jgi:hypothetical protein
LFSSLKLGPSGCSIFSGLMPWRFSFTRAERPDAEFFDTNDLHGVEIHDRANSFNRTSVTVIRRIATKETQRTCKPAMGIFLVTVGTAAPDIDHYERWFNIAIVFFEHGKELGAKENGLFAFDLLVDRHGRSRAFGSVFHRQTFVGRQIEVYSECTITGVVKANGRRLSVNNGVRRESEDLLLRGLVQNDADNPS